MSAQALFVTAGGGAIVLALLSWLWWRMSRRNRRALRTEVGKATMHEIASRRRE